ncbi:MAG: M15 family metallopeptidase [Gammaproteobacteria bacterium]|nr:M15 family metallopeptidase [Gammaproteobacteria bacterium]MCW5582773.1 M15 family metallopeptidase [Gammaproteobacteria bacterium]
MVKTWCYLGLFFLLIDLAYALPQGFVYLSEVDPTILQEMRYAGYHNFIGRPVKGYGSDVCILTKPAADALVAIQKKLLHSSLSLKVYDCYRPTTAVTDFIAWSKESVHQEMKQEFYPHINKADVFRLGYVAKKSGHSRGSTVDLTIVPMPAPLQAKYYKGQKLVACTAPYMQRFRDNSIDMGTGFDCLDKVAHAFSNNIHGIAYQNRIRLRQIMLEHGFEPYTYEWWHFTLKEEPYPDSYFSFDVK